MPSRLDDNRVTKQRLICRCSHDIEDHVIRGNPRFDKPSDPAHLTYCKKCKCIGFRDKELAEEKE